MLNTPRPRPISRSRLIRIQKATAPPVSLPRDPARSPGILQKMYVAPASPVQNEETKTEVLRFKTATWPPRYRDEFVMDPNGKLDANEKEKVDPRNEEVHMDETKADAIELAFEPSPEPSPECQQNQVDCKDDGISYKLVKSLVEVAADSKVQVTVASAAGGAAILAASGGMVGLLSGGAVGAACGVIPALFTFGLSIPIGAVIGGGTGACIGTSIGGTTGVLVGGALGSCAHTWWKGRPEADQEMEASVTSSGGGAATEVGPCEGICQTMVISG